MLDNYIQYKINRYYASKLVPIVAEKIKEEAELYFTKDKVMLAVGLDCFAEKSWKEEIKGTITDYSEFTPYGTYFSCNTAAQDVAISKYIPGIISLRERKIRKEFWSRLSIVIHQPARKITNELNESIDIKDLFVRIPLSESGFIIPQFRYIRTTMTKRQFMYRYVHSHCPSFDYPEEWKKVCLGTGPIRNTIVSCSEQEEYDEMETKMFFWELDKIIGIESLQGGPYKKLSDIVKVKTVARDTKVNVVKLQKELMPFVKSYLASGKFKPVFRGGSWQLSMDFLKWLAELTDYWTIWRRSNVDYLSNNPIYAITGTYYIKDGILVVPRRSRAERLDEDSIRRMEGQKILAFNGVDFNFKVEEDAAYDGPKTINLIQPEIGTAILYGLLQTLNYAYDTTEDELSWESLVAGKKPRRKIREIPDFI